LVNDEQSRVGGGKIIPFGIYSNFLDELKLILYWIWVNAR
jgi:hypothetical protein